MKLNSEQAENPSIYVHEWMIIVFLILNLVLLTSVSHSCSSVNIGSHEKHVHELTKTDIEVSIDGFVEFPGSYTFKKGAKVKELVALAKLKANADLKRLNMDAKLKNGQQIKISGQQMIKVILNFGNGVNQELEVKKGTKLVDLTLIYPFQENVNCQKLEKKRFLKDGEIIKIDFKR